MKIYLLLLALALCNIACAQSFLGKGSRKLAADLSGTTSANLMNSTVIDPTESGNNVDVTVNTTLPDSNTNNTNATTSVADGWESVDIEEFMNDPVLMEVHYYALTYANELGTQATVFPGPVTGSNITKMFKQVVDGVNYKIDSVLSNDAGTIIEVSALVYYKAETNSREMLNFTFAYPLLEENNIISNVNVSWAKESDKFTIDMVPTGDLSWGNQDPSSMTPQHYDLDLTGFLALSGYSPIPVDQVNSDQSLSNYLIYGVQQTVGNGIDYQYLASQPDYNLVQIYSIYGQQSADGSVQWYRCEVGIDNGVGGTATISFEVHVEPNSQYIDVPTFGYKVIQNTSSAN